MKAYAVSTITVAVVLNELCEVLHDVTAAHTKTVNRKETNRQNKTKTSKQNYRPPSHHPHPKRENKRQQ